MNDANVLVVGGTGGIGSAITRRLARDWARVTLTYHSSKQAAEALCSELAATTDIAAVYLDLTDHAAIQSALAQAEARGGIQSIVYASGVMISQPYVSQITLVEWNEVIQTELLGLLAIVQHALPILRNSGGSLVNIGSFGTRWFPPGDALSAVPKAATEMLCRAIAKEEGRYGIRANTVAPGIIEAGIGAELMGSIYSPEVWENQKKRTPLRRFGLAEDIANAAAFLCSDQSIYITGQTLIVDGGLSL